jgi:hypothetical protein
MFFIMMLKATLPQAKNYIEKLKRNLTLLKVPLDNNGFLKLNMLMIASWFGKPMSVSERTRVEISLIRSPSN